MAESFLWGLAAASSLLVGGLAAVLVPIRSRVLGGIMAFGAGVLISAVSFELVEDAFEQTGWSTALAVGLLAGCAAFSLGDFLIDRMGGADRKSMTGGEEAGSPLAIVLGIVLDGIPESFVIGLTIVEGGAVSVAFLLAVFLSNVPEAVAATSGLVATGWQRSRIFGLWALVAVVSGLAAAAGYLFFQESQPEAVAFVLAFAGGAILTMLADTMMPEAFARGGKIAGICTTLGFALAFAVSMAE